MSSVAEIQVLRELHSIVPAWQQLFAESCDATPFQSPEWLVPWWSSFGQGDPFVVAVHKPQGLAGLGLFYIYEGDVTRGPQLFFVGKSASDYLDILVAPGEDRTQTAQQIFDCVFESAASWRFIDLDHLRSSSPVLQIDAAPGISRSTIQEGVCPEVHLPSADIKQITSRNTSNSIRKHLNRAHTLGSVEFIRADQASFSSLMSRLVSLHTTRWNSAGLPGIFADARMVSFLGQAGLGLLRSGHLRLHAMLLNSIPIAVSFGILHRDRNYFYLCDFDLAYTSISPGTLLTAHAMQEAARRGARYFDFLQGEEEYKYTKWRAQPGYTQRLRFWHG